MIKQAIPLLIEQSDRHAYGDCGAGVQATHLDDPARVAAEKLVYAIMMYSGRPVDDVVPAATRESMVAYIQGAKMALILHNWNDKSPVQMDSLLDVINQTQGVFLAAKS